jgi:hypothetical protein
MAPRLGSRGGSRRIASNDPRSQFEAIAQAFALRRESPMPETQPPLSPSPAPNPPRDVPKIPLPAKRLREALLKNNLTPLPSVASVVIRISPTEVRVFKKPEVYSADGSYLVFGVPFNDAEPGEPPP